MSEQRKMTFNGEEVVGNPVRITTTPVEPWQEYLLEDGSVARVKLVMTEFTRIEGKYEVDGTPQYMSKFQVVTVVSPAESLRKR